MKTSPSLGRILAFAALGAMLFSAPALRAQQDTPPSSGQGGADQGAMPAPPESVPGPVGGIEAFHFGGPSLGHSFIVPRLSLQEVYDSNAGYAATAGASQADAITSVSGGLTLQLIKRNSTLSLDYTSQGLLYNSQTQSNGVVQQLNVTDKFTVRRWNLLVGESFAYLPNSAFALGGLGYLGGGTSGVSGIGGVTSFNPSQIPTQSIIAPNTSQLSSSSFFQAQYLINGNNSITSSVSVGFLHFFGSPLLDSHDVSTRIGYDRSLTPRDTINFSYTATVIGYAAGTPGFYSQYIQVGYRRFLTGRLHASVSAGPVISNFSPTTGQTTVPGGSTLVQWSLSAGLDYALRRASLGVQYTHGVAGGSGVFAGAEVDEFSGRFSTHVSRVWSANFTGGYSRNGALQQTSGVTTTSQPAFNAWSFGAGISRPIGHYSSLSFAYNATRQTSNAPMCVNTVVCGPVALVQVIGATFNWSTRPYRLE